MRTLLALLDRLSLATIGVIALVTTAVIGLVDFTIGHEVSTALFYVLPISIASWYGGRRLGILVSLLAAATWLVTDIGAGREYSHPAILPWNTFVRLAIFLLIALLLAAFRGLLRAEALAADTDHLTGAFNVRGFSSRLAIEYARSSRFNHRFSLAYLDVDNFKQLNDTLGHSAGNELLITLVRVLKRNLRKTDVVGRLGGDEFAVLFPETTGMHVREACAHLRQRLTRSVQTRGWPVSFSIGVVSFETLPDSAAEALAITDRLMYRVKHTTKNDLVHESWHRTEARGRTGTG